jgi:hypothetical protein
MTVMKQVPRWSLLAATMLAVFTAQPCADAQTQDRSVALAIVAGPFQYDLSGTGTSVFGAVRLDIPLTRYVVFEPGVTVGRYDPQFGSKITLIFPELQMQLRAPSDAVSPYLGAGVGPAFAIRGGQSETELFLTGALGVRVRLSSEWGMRGELRVRAIDPFAGTTAEWGIGISRRL